MAALHCENGEVSVSGQIAARTKPFEFGAKACEMALRRLDYRAVLQAGLRNTCQAHAMMLAILLATAAATAVPAPGHNWFAEYQKCLDDNAQDLDDHISDAATIGAVISRLCDFERRQSIYQSVQPGQPASMTQAEIDDKAAAVEDATTHVLMERWHRREPLPTKR